MLGSYQKKLLLLTLGLFIGVQVCLSACLPQQAAAQCDASCDSLFNAPVCGSSCWERSTLSGDWCGLRSCFEEKGYTWNISNTNFYSDITSGGLDETSRYRGRVDMFLNIDGKKVGLWDGLTINLHGESVFGSSINQFSGTLLPVSVAQILPDGNRDVTALTNVTFTQALSESVLVQAGKINTLDGFVQPFTGGANGQDGFQNLALCFNPVLVTAFPYSSFGAGMVVLDENQEAVFSAFVYDANNTPTVSGFDTFFDNGVSLFASATLPTKLMNKPGHQMVYGLYSSGTYNSLDPNPYFDPGQGVVLANPDKTGSWLLAYAFDQALYVSPDDPTRSWGVFGNVGIADDNPNPFNWAANIGVGGSNPIGNRPQDTFGIGYFYAGVSEPLKQLAPILLPLQDEQGVEMFYNVGVPPWCHVTADLQVVEPARSRVDTMVMFGLRAKFDL
ncbi:carbohydrate porin [Aureliella helgolandensis]|uniref:Porin B n=1 Tax=Aureliella helgolandensis TaxID=2527968 RepID=A0A518G6H8_9BACT|nr:carbohydrate porin [Aureliella helgolandensis]QDV24193.1 Porin B precursor [Aureliella helgolandensis]